MNWLTRWVHVAFPPVTGLEVDEPDPIALQVPPSPERFFRALAVLVSPDAVLYWEGPADRTLATWLNRQTMEPRPPVSFGIAPVPDFYHVRLTPDVLVELAARVARAGAAGRRVRLHVREGPRIVVQWHPAFGTRPLLLSRRLSSERVRAFIEAAAATPLVKKRPREARSR